MVNNTSRATGGCPVLYIAILTSKKPVMCHEGHAATNT